MNRLYAFVFSFLLFAVNAYAQRNVTLQHFVSDASYTQLNVPQNSILFSRFETSAPCSITKVTLGVYNTAATDDSIVFVMFADNGGSAFPYRFISLATPTKIILPGSVNGNLEVNLNPPIQLENPSVFFVGIRRAGTTANLKMDRVSQTPTCINVSGDTMITSGFAIPSGPGRYGWGYKFNDGSLANNYYISVDVTYTNENPSTLFIESATLAGLDATTSARRMAWADYDGDGFQDLLLGNKLFRNKKDGTFQDVSASVGYSKGGAVNMFADFDNDGDLDIICMPDSLLYVNTNGVFSPKANNGLGQSLATRSMTIADYDGDKFPDVFVGNGEYMYMKNPQNSNDSALVTGMGYTSHLYKGNGDNTFVDKTSIALNGYSKSNYGINPYTGQNNVNGYRSLEGAQWCDFDQDGDPDLYVTTARGWENYLFQNQGLSGGNVRFTNVASSKNVHGNFKAGTSNYGHSIGCEWADYDNNGTMDLIVANQVDAVFWNLFDKTSLYKNNGAPNFTFADQQPNAKIGYTETQSDVAFGDFNNDGLMDLYIGAANGCYKGSLFQQNPDRTFTDVTYFSGTSAEDVWGATWVDYDNDGDLDLAALAGNMLRLFRNEVNNQNKWVELALKSVTANSFALGARVTVVTGALRQTKEVTAGKGAGSQGPYTLHFGVDVAVDKIDTVIVRWPKGNVERFTNVVINKVNTISETPAQPKPVITVTPMSVTFTNTYVNQFTEQSISVRNGGDANLTITEQVILNSPQTEFVITQALQTTILPLNTATVKVKFQPKTSGIKTAQLRIGSNDPDNATVLVNLNGTALVSVTQLPGIPTATMLHQNFPNPFSAKEGYTTEVRYDLRDEADVTIRVYNSLGSPVRELVGERQQAGSYSATFDATASGDVLPSGNYTIVMETRLNGNMQRYTRLMTLMK